MLSPSDSIIINDFKRRIPSEIITHILEIIVFGSRVRGDAKVNSDLDIAVLVDQRTENLERQLENIAYEVMFDNDFKIIISLKIFKGEIFQHALAQGYSFYRNVKNEGVTV